MVTAAFRRQEVLERFTELNRFLYQIDAAGTGLGAGARTLLQKALADAAGFRAGFDLQWAEIAGYSLPPENEDYRHRAQCGTAEDAITSVAAEILPILTGSDGSSVPVDLEHIVQSVLPTGWPVRCVVIHTSPSYNYLVRSFDHAASLFSVAPLWREQSDGDSADDPNRQPVASGLAPQILLLTVPQIHWRSHLLHAVLLGHEIGHVRDWTNQRSESVSRPEDFARLLGSWQKRNPKKVDLYAPYEAGALEVYARWLAEFVADVYSVVTLGPAALFSLHTVTSGGSSAAASSLRDQLTHPSAQRRLALMLEVLTKHLGYGELATSAESLQPEKASEDEPPDPLVAELRWFQETYGAARTTPPDASQDRAIALAWKLLGGKLLNKLAAQCVEDVPADKRMTAAVWEGPVCSAAKRLGEGVPIGEHFDPEEGQMVPTSPEIVANAAWRVKLSGLTQIARNVSLPEDSDEHDRMLRASEVLDELVLKSLEIARYRLRARESRLSPASLPQAEIVQPEARGSSAEGAVLGRRQILKRLASSEMLITPLPADDAFGQGSVDLRVGTIFLTSKRSSSGWVDASPLGGETALRLPAAKLFHEEYTAPGQELIIHPGQFVLASTLEYLALPNDMCGIIQSRSTYGRMGLIAATASWVDPGYKGSPTLELINMGDVPIGIKPYTALCQIILMRADPELDARPSRYQCNTRPQYVRLRRDPYLEMWRPTAEE